ncbi:MAG: hypothetical protein D6757_01045 [Alphaproteobacteria bacterium]|nr:MAG: hypothetical protein D6757_01045 [Alphaproteobacteria bacterium]
MGRVTHIGDFNADALGEWTESRHHGGPWSQMLMLIEHGRRSRRANAARRARRDHRAFRSRLRTG